MSLALFILSRIRRTVRPMRSVTWGISYLVDKHDEDGTFPITKRISGAGTITIYICHVVVAKGRPYNCELLPDLSRTTIPRISCGATGLATNATHEQMFMERTLIIDLSCTSILHMSDTIR